MHPRACELYRTAETMDPRDSEWSRKVVECTIAHDGPAALAALIERHAGNDERLGDIADQLAELGRNGRACELYQEALRLDPDDSEWRGKTSTCALRTATPDQLEQLVQAQSKNDEAVGDIADRYVELGQRQRACELYHQAATLDPDDPEWRRKANECGNTGAPPAERRPSPPPK